MRRLSLAWIPWGLFGGGLIGAAVMTGDLSWLGLLVFNLMGLPLLLIFQEDLNEKIWLRCSTCRDWVGLKPIPYEALDDAHARIVQGQYFITNKCSACGTNLTAAFKATPYYARLAKAAATNAAHAELVEVITQVAELPTSSEGVTTPVEERTDS